MKNINVITSNANGIIHVNAHIAHITWYLQDNKKNQIRKIIAKVWKDIDTTVTEGCCKVTPIKSTLSSNNKNINDKLKAPNIERSPSLYVESPFTVEYDVPA